MLLKVKTENRDVPHFPHGGIAFRYSGNRVRPDFPHDGMAFRYAGNGVRPDFLF